MLDFNNLETYMLIVHACEQYAVDPSSSLESEEFFRNLLSQYKGPPDPASLTTWLEDVIQRHFVPIGERPRWIQEPQWPFADGKPMVFAGQIDLSTKDSEVVSQLFHDDTSLYVFVAPKVQPVVVIQQF